MSLKSHAEREFFAAGWTDKAGNFKDEMQELICKQILELLQVFSDHGHSGSTAPYAINLFSKLAKFEPIVPLTGEDWEFNEVSEGVFQNNRCSHVFKQADRFDGQPYDIEGKVFYEWVERDLEEDEDGFPGKHKYKSCYTNSGSRVPVTFPYTPSTEYVEVTNT
ncbi:MAG: hypothetical protein ACRDDC_02335 [Tannerellaceae bacterium]